MFWFDSVFMKSRLEKNNSLKPLWYKTHFLFPHSLSVYNKWTPVKLKKNHTFLNGMFFFFSFFFQEITELKKYSVYSIFFCQSWWPTCCFCGFDSFDEWEKRLGYHLLQSSSDGHSCSGLGFPLRSYNKSQDNTSTIQLLKQRLKDQKCSLDLKTFL